MNSRQKVQVYAALAASMGVWGISFLVTKQVVDVLPVSTLLSMRFLLAVIFLGVWAVARGELRVPKRDLLMLAALAVLSPVGYFLFETHGVARTQASHASVIVAVIPAVVFILAMLFRQEKFSWRKALGIAVAYAGVILVIGLGTSEAGASVLGDVLVLGAVACASVRTLFAKQILQKVTPLQLTFYQFLFSLVVFLPLAAADGFDWTARVTGSVLLGVLFLGLFCSALAFLGMHYALVHLPASGVSVAANFVPVVTLAAEIALYGTVPSAAKVVGMAMVIGGMVLAQAVKRDKGAADEQLLPGRVGG
ncbi:DMT family transporter [Candidatus Bipolaricaulota bacterium]|nr:DMT family transporter [Candidatus Bipolaricaulota bacterium]